MKNANIPQDLKNALTKFDSTATKILKTFEQKLELLELPQFIYHYTNDVGLKGILETGRLWSSDIFKLNDTSELIHGFSHAVKILNSKAKEGQWEQIFAKSFADFHHGGIPKAAHFFVCSFSTVDNDLGQWRAYADNGRGYALGFDANVLVNSFMNENGNPIPNNSTFHITYNDAELAKIHRQMIEDMFHLISLPQNRHLDDAIVKAYMHELSTSLSAHVLNAALYFKHEAYENESEFRFLQLYAADAPPEVKQSSRRYELVKYREFDWKHLQAGALKRIVVGPAADRTKATQFATDCLTAFNIENVKIECSDIPYRAV